MLRSVLAVLLGLAAAVVVMIGVESISHTLLPPPSVDLNDMAAVRAVMAGLPAGMYVMVLIAWGFAALTGGLLAGRLARRAPLAHAAVIGGLLTVGGLANFVMLSHPLWVVIGGLLLFLPMALLGGRLGARPRPVERGRLSSRTA